MDYKSAKTYILQKLRSGLSHHLHYHGLHHTLEVLGAVEDIAHVESISGDDLTLVKTAALFHDSGFLHTYKDHEAAGCALTRMALPQFGYTTEQIDHICDMIMATKIPQVPKDHLAEILCDADLFYLGTDAFYPIGDSLFKEFKEVGIIATEKEWNNLQVSFLESHSYFTETAQKICADRKERHLREVKDIVATYAA